MAHVPFDLRAACVTLKRAAPRVHARGPRKDIGLISFVPLATIDPPAIEHLLDRAFGADRHGRTAYRLREGMRAIPELSFAALEDGELVATIQCWPVRFSGAERAVEQMLDRGRVDGGER